MTQWFFRFSKFPESSEFNESFALFRENSITEPLHPCTGLFFYVCLPILVSHTLVNKLVTFSVVSIELKHEFS